MAVPVSFIFTALPFTLTSVLTGYFALPPGTVTKSSASTAEPTKTARARARSAFRDMFCLPPQDESRWVGKRTAVEQRDARTASFFQPHFPPASSEVGLFTHLASRQRQSEGRLL